MTSPGLIATVVTAEDARELSLVATREARTRVSDAIPSLVWRAQHGESAAFEQLITARVDHLYRLALAILRSEADAKDAVEETIVSSWRALPSLRDEGRFEPWLDRILVNSCRMMLRHRRVVRVHEISLASPEDVAARRVADLEQAAPDEGVASLELIREAFSRLDADQRALIVLHHVEGRAVDEIAEVLGIPVGTVMAAARIADGARASARGGATMIDKPILTDARIRLALLPAPEDVAPNGLLRDALDAAARTPQKRWRWRLPWDFAHAGWTPAVRTPALAWILIALLMLVLAGIAAVGQRPKEAPGLLGPQPSAVPQPSLGPAGVLRLFAVSLDEAYVVSGEGYDELWHFTEGRWDGPDRLPGGIGSVAVLRDGRVAAATSAGLVVQKVGGWAATPITGDTSALAAAADGSLWVSDRSPFTARYDLVHVSWVDGSWQEARVPCPVGGSYLAIGADGIVWSGGFFYNGTAGLARYDGWRCLATAIPGAGDRFEVGPPAPGPAGQLAIAGLAPPFDQEGVGTPFIAVFDGTRWSSPDVELTGDGFAFVAFDPAGDLLISTSTGIARRHRAEGDWVEAPVAAHVSAIGVVSLARDGTLWYVDPSGEIRRARP